LALGAGKSRVSPASPSSVLNNAATDMIDAASEGRDSDLSLIQLQNPPG